MAGLKNEFLGVPVPDVPYPHVNDTEDLKQIIYAKWRKYVLVDAAIVGAVLAVSLSAALTLRRLRS